MYNLSPQGHQHRGGTPLYYFNRQFGFALMGVVAMFIISKIDYQQFRWMSIFVLAGSVVLTYAGMKFFVDVCGVWPTPAKVVTTLLTALYSYLAAKYFTFRHAAG